MPSAEKIGTHHKALTLNLDPSAFGSFAEIGAGQEVARWFLIVGGASGTVAKTISAYDNEVSDDFYGSGLRYVSKRRLEAMLKREWLVRGPAVIPNFEARANVLSGRRDAAQLSDVGSAAFFDLLQQQARFDKFIEVFNSERPHEALDKKWFHCLATRNLQ